MPLNSSLPNGTLKVAGSTVAVIKKHIELQLQLPSTTCYIYFTNVPLAIGQQSNKHPIEIFGIKGARICYGEGARDLIVKLVDGPHEVAHYAFTKTILEQTCAMNLKSELAFIGSGRVTSKDLSKDLSKDPDASFSPWTLPPGRARQWPAVVAECGYSESTRHLRAIADLWISNSDGDVKVHLIISIERAKAKIIMEKWVPGQTARSTGPSLRSHGQHARREQELVITKARTEMFLRPLVPPTEHDFVIDAAELEDIAREIFSFVSSFFIVALTYFGEPGFG
ncbi:hypothetical protein BJX70DRAFT_411156 [Aspergillus crustosus]